MRARATEAVFTEVLRLVRLEHLIERCGGLHAAVDFDWCRCCPRARTHAGRYTVLSQGELQRLAFARLFFHTPRFAGTQA